MKTVDIQQQKYDIVSETVLSKNVDFEFSTKLFEN